jgi:hypothetical protein
LRTTPIRTSAADGNGADVRPDGTIFPPVTPDPPKPPGYEEPEVLDCGALEPPEERGDDADPPD